MSGAGILRAVFGQIMMQRIQEIHLLLSSFFGFALSMAPAGQFLAQRPQPVQLIDTTGLSGSPLYSRSG